MEVAPGPKAPEDLACPSNPRSFARDLGQPSSVALNIEFLPVVFPVV